MGADRWDEQVGSVADEAAKLLESLRRTAESAGEPAERGPGAPHAGDPTASDGGAEGAGEDGRPAPETGTHDPFCTWCPLCRTAEVVRSLSPETITRLADLASLAATVLADLASARTSGHPSDAGAGPHHRPAPRPSPSRPIPVRDADAHDPDDSDAHDPQEAPRG